MNMEKQKQLEVNIDFDYASKMWRENKGRLTYSEGSFYYICCAITSKGQPCKRKPLTGYNYCYTHNCNK